MVSPGIKANWPATFSPAPFRLIPSIKFFPVPPITTTVVVPAFANIPYPKEGSTVLEIPAT